MESNSNRESAGTPTRRQLDQRNWLVITLSLAGVVFILLGLLALALPTDYEGIRIWQVDDQHTVYMMDVAGVFVLALGFLLTWIGSKFWNRYVIS